MMTPKTFPLALCLLLALPAAAHAAAPGNAARGATLFQQDCGGCHTADKGAPNGVGPALFGVVGRPAARAAGFAYSPALKRSKLTWSGRSLDKWLLGPAALVPGTTMMTPPVADARDRRDLVAYLTTRAPAKRR